MRLENLKDKNCTAAFFRNLAALPKGTQVTLRRFAGQYTKQIPMSIQMAVFDCARELAPHPTEDDKQNLLFVASIFCSCNQALPMEKAETVLSERAMEQEGGRPKDLSDCIVSRIVDSTAGSIGRVYRPLAALLQRKPANINCTKLLIDLTYWKSRDTRVAWVDEYLRMLSRTKKKQSN